MARHLSRSAVDAVSSALVAVVVVLALVVVGTPSGSATLTLPVADAETGDRLNGVRELMVSVHRSTGTERHTVVMDTEGTATIPLSSGGVLAVTVEARGYEALTVSSFVGDSGSLKPIGGLGLVPHGHRELPWSAERPLRWEDFRGTAPADARARGQAAVVATRIAVQPFQFDVRREASGWVATVPAGALRVTNRMDRERSWSLADARTPALLAHEQGHFDLSEVYRRLLRDRMVDLVGRGATAAAAQQDLQNQLERISSEVNRRHQEAHRLYDAATEHGVNTNQQYEWEEQIAGWLLHPVRAP